MRESTGVLDPEDTQNEILAQIHNRLAEISKFLEIGIALYGKLNMEEIDFIKESLMNAVMLEYKAGGGTVVKKQYEDSSIGFETDKGLYHCDGSYYNCFPIGSGYTITRPIHDETGRFFTNNELEAIKKGESNA